MSEKPPWGDFDIAAFVAKTRKEQGLPRYIEDPAMYQLVVEYLRQPLVDEESSTHNKGGRER